MPVTISSKLPAFGALERENVFVMSSDRAEVQDIRPLEIAILNLMPNKIDTETQLLRLLANSPLQSEVVFLRTESYDPKNTPIEHMRSFYHTLDDVKSEKSKFDGLIITGAPVEMFDFKQVAYWRELENVMEWARHNVYSTLYICWAAQAGLYYRYGIDKKVLPRKLSGIFSHRVLDKTNPLTRGFDDMFMAPHSRHTESDSAAMHATPDLRVLAESEEAGVYLCCSKDLRHVFVFGHGEYDADTLHNEYMRDTERGLDIAPPQHYYPNGQIGVIPPLTWRAHESLLIGNWLNYCVYQETPYDIKAIK
ncbi:MAG: homoserine O-succinyltransferase [Roseburia sp.]|nr:homoserine O-succinyltransferase [Roseburia sp.]